MDKNTTIGLVLIALIFIGFSYFNKPSEEEIAQQQKAELVEKQQQKKDSVNAAKAKVEALKVAENALSDSTSAFFPSYSGESKTIMLKNKNVTVGINTKGGMLESATLADYDNQEGKNVELFSKTNENMSFVFATKSENINTDNLYFSAVESSDSSAILRAYAGNGGYIEFAYTLLPESYMVNFSMRMVGLANIFAPSTKKFDISWNEHLAQQEKGFSFENRYATITYKKTGEGTDYIGDNGAKQENVEEACDWIAFKNQFFSYVFIAEKVFTDVNIESTPDQKGSGFLKTYNAEMKSQFDPSGASASNFQFYVGPNKFRILQASNELSLSGKELSLDKLVYLGWPLFRWINRWFTIYVFDFLTGMGLNMGIVLLIITLLLKAITYPFVRKSFLASAKMRVLKPKIDALNEKYKDPADTMKKQQEMMMIYQQYGANPMGGCVPMLIQMPIWIAMFNFVPNAIELRRQSFLWADDLSTYDSIITWGNDIWLIGDHLSLFCILFCATNIVYSFMTMRQQRETMSGPQADQMKVMQWMMYIMPVAFFFMFNEYSSGLNYYYFISLLFSALIMYILRKTTDDDKLLAQLEANYQKNKNNPGKMSSLMKRMEELQRRQEEMQKRYKK